jgi:hypothetical protein
MPLILGKGGFHARTRTGGRKCGQRSGGGGGGGGGRGTGGADSHSSKSHRRRRPGNNIGIGQHNGIIGLKSSIQGGVVICSGVATGAATVGAVRSVGGGGDGGGGRVVVSEV